MQIEKVALKGFEVVIKLSAYEAYALQLVLGRADTDDTSPGFYLEELVSRLDGVLGLDVYSECSGSLDSGMDFDPDSRADFEKSVGEALSV